MSPCPGCFDKSCSTCGSQMVDDRTMPDPLWPEQTDYDFFRPWWETPVVQPFVLRFAWVCPRCSRSNAPHVDVCACSTFGVTISTAAKISAEPKPVTFGEIKFTATARQCEAIAGCSKCAHVEPIEMLGKPCPRCKNKLGPADRFVDKVEFHDEPERFVDKVEFHDEPERFVDEYARACGLTCGIPGCWCKSQPEPVDTSPVAGTQPKTGQNECG